MNEEEKNKIHIETYITKEKFIQMITNLNYVAINGATIHFITGFEYEPKENITQTRGYDIQIY